jgi:UDP-N-acetylglucosamine diphosphorylase / glucose-1-phosphate thymidylyltransferase / UDP-N-acetylgalactosamine diphosphorylase / glucosamine-1-phosphate N-acetyltransferase / galactosamine-1-phosphate N-acetyltransferase
MTALFVYDDNKARAFEPFATTRPISEMVAGTMSIRERWRLVAPLAESRFLAGSRHELFDEPGAQAGIGVIPAGSIIAHARCVPAIPLDRGAAVRRLAACSMWRCGDRLAAVRIKDSLDAAAFDDGLLTLEQLYAGTGAVGSIEGWWLDEVWDFIRHLPDQLASDIPRLAAAAKSSTRTPQHVAILGDNEIAIIDGGEDSAGATATVIEPHVVLDATAGPIFINAGTHIRAFTRITGPCYIGRSVSIMGGDITGCSIGDVSKVRGELSSTIVLGHSNKGHDGFVGHSYVGRWVNLGAGTTTSNLKNTYGTVQLWTPDGLRDTGLQFLGTMFGDHVKTGIGLCLTTGTVLGAGANVYGAMPPKVVAPFSWGDGPPYSVYRADKFVQTAERMMARRHVGLTDRGRRHIASVHAGRWTAATPTTAESEIRPK